LLIVTGSEDDDSYGISSPYVRTAIWEYAPPGNNFLLQLSALTLLVEYDGGVIVLLLGIGVPKRVDVSLLLVPIFNLPG
jgi:hypothetical protein